MKFPVALTFVSALLASGAAPADSGIPTGQEIQAQAEQQTRAIDTDALRRLIDTEPDLVLIDIRTKDEIDSHGGAIDAPQRVHIPRGWLEFRVQQVAASPDTPIVVYCGAGLRTPLAAKTLQEMGYRNVRDYSVGFFGWQKAGLAIAN